jgi:HAD superfamily hydrolase (TIGR01450 family)
MGSQLTAWALDLDGVIWRGTDTVPGSPEAVELLRNAGHRVAFVTNSALRTPAQVADKLASHGIDNAEAEVVTAAMAAATMVEPEERVLAIGSQGLLDALSERGAELVTDGPASAVIVGITFEFDYDSMRRAMQAIHGGARFIATNLDPTYPAADGLLPGNGALVAAVAAAAGVEPAVAGKPFAPIAALTRALIGEKGIMVGDRPDTDGDFATEMGYDFGLVLSGVTGPADFPVTPTPSVTGDDLLALVRSSLGA